MKTIIFIITVLVLLTVPFFLIEENKCYRVQYIDPHIGTFYWKWLHKSDSHGICATMYSSDDYLLWTVEKPEKDKPTAIYIFNDHSIAEEFAESKCNSIDKKWQVVIK